MVTNLKKAPSSLTHSHQNPKPKVVFSLRLGLCSLVSCMASHTPPCGRVRGLDLSYCSKNSAPRQAGLFGFAFPYYREANLFEPQSYGVSNGPYTPSKGLFLLVIGLKSISDHRDFFTRRTSYRPGRLLFPENCTAVGHMRDLHPLRSAVNLPQTKKKGAVLKTKSVLRKDLAMGQ